MAHVLPQIEAAGGKYLARGGPHTVYEGDWSPYRLVLLEFPSREAFEGLPLACCLTSVPGLARLCRVAGRVGVT